MKERGPNIVALGGGTGLPNLLRGLKPYTTNLSAIVTVTDDGGSSGRLRGEMGVLPPGDVRNCLIALADAEPLLKQIFNYRFQSVEGLSGHNIGNLIIAALSENHGFEEAIKSLSRVLAVKGRVLPVTDQEVTLKAVLDNGEEVWGESQISEREEEIHKIELVQDGIAPLEEVIDSIKRADAIVMGPGSLYTSILPVLLVPQVVDEIRSSPANKIFISNIMTQPGETKGYRASDHIKTIYCHGGYNLIDTVFLNDASTLSPETLEKYYYEGQEPVEIDLQNIKNLRVKPVIGNFSSKGEFLRHDPDLIGEAVIKEIINSN